jgi:hypothetical protein
MWINSNTGKPVTLRRLIQHPGEIHTVTPEPLHDACIVTNAVYWLLELEQLASEQDPATLERALHELIARHTPLA